MSILTRLFGSKNRPTMTDGQPPSARSLLKARTPPWHKVAPIVIDAIFEALGDTDLFDCFVLSSMENKLVAQFEQLGRDDDDVSVIRAQISGILCQAGFREIAKLEKEVNNKRIDVARKIGFAATNLFEPAIAMSKDQIAGYLGMATIYELLGVQAQCREWAKRGLLELQKTKQSPAGQAMRHSAVFPPDMLDRAEQQLLGYLEGTPDNPEAATAAPPSHAPDDTTRIGRRGICMLCGTLKSGSFDICEECGFQPLSDEEIAIALMLNEASMRNFEQVVGAIKSGQLPEFKKEDFQKFMGAVPGVRRMIGLQHGRYRTRAKTEDLLTFSVKVATQVMSNTIAKIVPGGLKEISKERMLAICGRMIKKELLKLAPDSEKEFIERFFGKRLVRMSMQSLLPELAEMERDEFALRVVKAIYYFDSKNLNVSGDKFALENTVMPFVFSNVDAIYSYRERFPGDPCIGFFLRSLVDSYASALSERAKGWR
jgi:hypothetical protein